MPTIYLSPSAEGYNAISGGATSDKDYTGQIMDAMEPYLTASGVTFGRSKPGMTAEQAIEASNAGMYDMHLALLSQPLPIGNGNMQQGVQVFFWPVDENSKRLAGIISKNLKTLVPNASQIKPIPTSALGEVSQTHAPASLVAIYYPATADARSWIESNIQNIARNLALSISQYFDVPYIEPAAPQRGTVDLTSGTLNIRARPVNTAPVITTAGDGEPVMILGEWNGWFLVRFGNHTGYVRSEYITLNY